MELYRSPLWRQASTGWRLLLFISAAAVLILAATGCQRLGKNTPNTVATVVVPNQSMGKVGAATEIVFVKYKYQGGRTGTSQYTYQRLGSSMDAVVYGEWIDRKVALKAVVTLNE